MKKILPDTQRIVELREDGKTYSEIAAWVKAKYGYPVAATSLAAAVSRAGKATRPVNRYADHIPWTVKAVHTRHYAVRMLRLMGRRDQGLSISEVEATKLDNWLERLATERAIVAYAPDTEEGFFYIDGRPNAKGVPIRKTPL